MPIWDRLSHRGILMNSIFCPICSCNVETIEHIFAWAGRDLGVHCYLVEHLDSRIDLPLFSCFVVWFCFYERWSTYRKAFDVVVTTSFWCIWNFQNSSIFGAAVRMKSLLFDDIVYKTFFFGYNRCRNAKISWSSWLYNPIYATNLL